MTSPRWPSIIPHQGPVDGIAPGQSYASPQSSETEGGPPIMRPRPGPRITEFPWRSKILTHAQWQAFEQFTRIDLRQGSLAFWMPVFTPGGSYANRLCQIKGGEWSSDLTRIRVSFTRIVYNW